VLALLLAGCGSASSTRTSGSAASTTARTTGTTASSIHPGSVAVAVGMPITHTEFLHWMYVAVESQTQAQPGVATIVPTDPPGFSAG
jgi:hypothetical protein